jgi:hypothetical protein
MDLREDIDELRARVQLETEEALRLADDLAAEVARRPASPEAAALTANYLQVRMLLHRIRRVLAVEVAG